MMLHATLFLIVALTAVQGQIPAERYRWRASQWTNCSQPCGGSGMQSRRVECRETLSGRRGESRDCEATGIMRPSTSQVCGLTDCEIEVNFVPGPCSVSCGGGVRLAVARCTQVLANGSKVSLKPEECQTGSFSTLGTCNTHHCPAKYELGEWVACSKTCGTGIQTRSVQCQRMVRGRQRAVPHHFCRRSQGKVESTRKCENDFVCPDNYYWKAEKWSPCMVTCQRHRKVRCFSEKDSAYVDKKLCQNLGNMPEVEGCINSGMYVWRALDWGSCSATCGGGHRMRELRCVHFRTNQAASSCPICLKPEDSISCAERPCPGSLGAGEPCVDKSSICPFLARLNQCGVLERNRGKGLHYCCKSCTTKDEAGPDTQLERGPQ